MSPSVPAYGGEWYCRGDSIRIRLDRWESQPGAGRQDAAGLFFRGDRKKPKKP